MSAKTPLNSLRTGPIITIVLGALALAYVFFMFLPAQRSIRDLQSDLRKKQRDIAQSEGTAEQLSRTELEVTEAKAFAQAWRGRAPDSKRISGFYAALIDSAHAAGLKTLRFDPGPPETLNMLERIPVELEVQGTFPQIFELTERIERLRLPVWLDTIKIESKSENREDLECELKLAVFAARSEVSD